MLPGIGGMMAGVDGAYIAQGVNFDGTNDYLTRGADLTGAADGKSGVASVWYRSAGDGTTHRILSNATTVGGATGRVALNKGPGDLFSFLATNAAGTVILNLETSMNSVEAADGWKHFLVSFDLTNVARRHAYVSDVSDLNPLTFTDDTIDYTVADWSIGARPSGADKANGDVADFMFWMNTYIDFSVEANRRMFISAAGKPVNPAVAIATLGTPIVALHGPTSAWEVNKGSGGGFTEIGALTDASSSPSA